jgi:hypothetical protein
MTSAMEKELERLEEIGHVVVCEKVGSYILYSSQEKTLTKICDKDGKIGFCVIDVSSRDIGKFVRKFGDVTIHEHYMFHCAQEKDVYTFAKCGKNGDGETVEIKYDYNFQEKYIVGIANGFGIIYDVQNFRSVKQCNWKHDDKTTVHPCVVCGEPCLFLWGPGSRFETKSSYGALISEKFSAWVEFDGQFEEISKNGLVAANEVTGLLETTALKKFHWTIGGDYCPKDC